ncbi:MAG: hypothetical protein ACOWWO_01600 [Peptococcaceae bacterium]
MENRVRELQNRKKEYLQNIYELTLAQKKSLEDHDTDKLQKVIHEKEMVIHKINSINSELNSVKEDNNEEYRRILKLIMDLDRENRQKADQVLLALKEKLGKVRRGKRAYKAYNPYPAQAAFINKAR